MKERKKQRVGWGGLEEERKPGASTPPESKNPDLKKMSESKAEQWINIYWRWTTIHPYEDSGSKNYQLHLLPFGKHNLLYPNRGLAVGQVYLYIWKEVVIAAFTLCFEKNIAELLYVLCSNHYDGSKLPRYYCVV